MAPCWEQGEVILTVRDSTTSHNCVSDHERSRGAKNLTAVGVQIQRGSTCTNCRQDAFPVAQLVACSTSLTGIVCRLSVTDYAAFVASYAFEDESTEGGSAGDAKDEIVGGLIIPKETKRKEQTARPREQNKNGSNLTTTEDPKSVKKIT